MTTPTTTNPYRSHPMTRLPALLLLLCLFALPACDSMPSIDDVRTYAAAVEQDVQAARAVLESAVPARDAYAAQVAAMDPGEEKDAAQAILDGMNTAIDKPLAVIDKGEAILAHVNAQLAKAEAGDDFALAEIGVGTASKFAPAPWGALIGLAGTTIIGFLRAAQNRRAARQIVKSVNPIVRNAGETERTAIAARQTPEAERIVDEAMGKRLALPL